MNFNLFSFYFFNMAYGKLEITCKASIIFLWVSAALTTIPASPGAAQPRQTSTRHRAGLSTLGDEPAPPQNPQEKVTAPQQAALEGLRVEPGLASQPSTSEA